MDERERKHIQDNLRQLLDLIRVNAGFIAVIQQEGILDRSEISRLVSSSLTSYIKSVENQDNNMYYIFLKDSIPDQYEKTRELLKILELKLNGYSILLNAVTDTKQSGAEGILRQLKQQQPSITQSHVTANLENSTHSKYQLVFGNELTMSQILQRLKYRLVRCLSNKNSNTSVILQLEALGLFDSDEIGPILNGTYQTEQKRMTELFEVINGR